MKALKVLVVDDDEGFAEVIQHVLDHEGYETRATASVAEAFRIFLVFRPGLVISDLQMPGESGVELIRRMRKAYNTDFKTVYMSGDLDQFHTELEEEREKYHVTLLAKPFRRIELVRLVSEFERALVMRAA